MSGREVRDTPWAAVAEILEEGYSVVINRGSRDGVKEGQKFLIYEISPEEIRDPINGESLGHLEIVKGTGVVSHLQERMATVTSDRRTQRRLVSRPIRDYGRLIWGPIGAASETEELETHLEPFKSPKVGDRAKPI